MLVDALQFLLDILLQPIAVLLLLRFHLQWLRAPLRNPLGELIMLLTNFAVLRARRLIPSAWGLDMATLLLAFGVEMFYLFMTTWVHGFTLIGLHPFLLLAWAMVKLIKISVFLLMAALLLTALLSWTNPHTPYASVLASVTRPFLRPLRRFMPPVGGFDFSVLVLFILCQLILMVPLNWLEGLVLRQLT